MADSPAFDLTCEVLERQTSLDRLEARGTVRLVLKAAGLDPRNVSPDQMATVAKKLLPSELESRGVSDGERVCTVLDAGLSRIESAGPASSPEAVFARLGGS